MEFLICSNALPVANMAKELAKTVFPQAARPAATDIILPSAMPQLKNLSGNFLPKIAVLVEPERSASRTTMFSFVSPSSASVRP